MAGADTVLYPALLVAPAGLYPAGDLATRPALTQPLALMAWVEGGTHHIVSSMVEAAALAHGHTGVTTEHEAGITDAALTADGLTALRG